MEEKAGPWKLTTDDWYSEWVLYRTIKEFDGIRLEFYPDHFKTKAEADRKVDELNGKDHH